jgi:glycosyltransferase involved in cell wall biosynthesis
MKSHKAICCVIANNSRSFATLRWELLQALAQQYSVHVLAPEFSAELQQKLITLGVIPHCYALEARGMNILQDLKAMYSLYRYCKQQRPALVFCYTPKAVIYGALAAFTARVPRIVVMLTGLGYAFSAGGWRRALLRQLQCMLYRLVFLVSNLVIFHNDDDAKFMIQRGLVPAAKTAVVPGSGVNLQHFTDMPLPERLSFLCMARLLREKGVYEYLAAARQLKAQDPALLFYVSGEAELLRNQALFDAVLAAQQEGVITYLGAPGDVRLHLQLASVVVLPSYREGLPKVLLEAMAMGRPVLTTDVPGCRQLLPNLPPGSQPGKAHGWLVPVRDAAQLAAAMQRIVAEAEQLPAMGAAARAWVSAVYDVRLVNTRMLQLLGGAALSRERAC